MLSDLLYRLRAWLRPGRADRDLADELAFHELQEVAKLEARGLDAIAARRRARVAFGGPSAVAEECRDARGIRWIDETSKDFRYAIRGFLRTPLFTLTVAASLVLGVGLNATMFTLMHATLWRPLPIPAPEEVVHIRRVRPLDTSGRESSYSYVLFRMIHDSAAPGADVVAKRTPVRRKFGLTPESRERVVGDAVSDRWFAVLGVRPASGRLLRDGDDDVGGGRNVAVLSHRFWVTRFQADPATIGRTIYYDERPFLVVGVAEAGFSGVDAETPVDLWTPLTADPAISPVWLRESSFNWLTLVARVRNGASRSAIESAVDGAFQSHLETAILPGIPARLRERFSGEHIQFRPAAAGLATTGRRYAPQLSLLGAIAACVLLICCLNVANLVRARNDSRMHEFALRRALGASRGRIFRQLAAEGALIAMVAIGGGLALAPWAGRLLLSLVPGAAEAFDLAPDVMIVVATMAAGLATTFLAVVAPAWRTLKGQAALGAGSRVSARWGAHRTMVASQLAAALVLLAIAGLCLTTVRRLQSVPLGFDPSSVVSVELSFPRDTAGPTVVQTIERIRTHLEQLPLVENASYVAPWVYADNSGTSMGITPADYVARPGEDTLAGVVMAGPDFFDVMRMPLQRGRSFAPDEVIGHREVLLVNETFARKYFGDKSPLGLRVRLPRPGGPVTSEIIGVVRDARHYGVHADIWPMVYLPAGCGSCGSDRPRLIVRTATSATPLAILRTEIESIDPIAQVESVYPLDESIGAVISAERLLATLSTVVAAIAIALAALGLYGLVAYGVTQRLTEFGIRLALGATPGSVHALVLKETFGLAIAGVVVGTVCAVLAGRFVQRLVTNSAALDWQTLSVAAIGLLAVALAAGWFPATRAARTDPAGTLRAE